MDHLPKPDNALYGNPEVPYLLDKYPHVGQYQPGWWEYLERFRFDRARFKQGQFVQNDRFGPGETACVLQQWLFFGVLSFIRCDSFTMDELECRFTRDHPDPGKSYRVIDTSGLAVYLKDWIDGFSLSQTESGSESQSQTSKVMQEFWCHYKMYIEYKGDFSNSPQNPFIMLPGVAISLALLGWAVACEFSELCHPEGLFRLTSDFHYDNWKIKEKLLNEGEWIFKGTPFMVARMESAGWCISDIITFAERLNAAAMYFVSQSKPPRGGMNHVNCDLRGCQAMTITEAVKRTYRPRHEPACCGDCTMEIVDSGVFCSLLKEGQSIPTVSFVSSAGQPPSLLLRKTEPGQKFVAISHVWIERLGNVERNALPTCVLKTIQSRVNEAMGGQDTPFWMDTLCVPRGNSKKMRHFRRQAIRQMAYVYERATFVLVIDNQLLSVSQESTDHDICLRLMCSSWLRRLWTLQEGILCNSVILQLKNGQINLRKLGPKNRSTSTMDAVYWGLHEYIMQALLGAKFACGPLISSLITSCHHRATSIPEDEVLCLRIILRLRLSPATCAPYTLWTRFLQDQCFFPIEVVFMPGTRVGTPGYRWAPSSFVRRPLWQRNFVGVSRNLGMATGDGFLFNCPGLVIEPSHDPSHLDRNLVYIKLPRKDKWCVLQWAEPPSDEYKVLYSRSEIIDRARRAEQLAVITSDKLDESTSSEGVLVSLSRTSLLRPSGCIGVEYLANVLVGNSDHVYWLNEQSHPIRYAQLVESQIPLLQAEKCLSETQTWCLS